MTTDFYKFLLSTFVPMPRTYFKLNYVYLFWFRFDDLEAIYQLHHRIEYVFLLRLDMQKFAALS